MMQGRSLITVRPVDDDVSIDELQKAACDRAPGAAMHTTWA
jgi:hypothetical protein